ncbi:FIG00732100: hypothetical protein [Klebsiella pneumoniae]|nr:FIG00732100: hypothetical protein [Klebsiella pneumoniae]
MIKIARIAVTLGLLSSLGVQAYAAGLVVNDNDLRNDLAWLSDRGIIHLSLSTWPLSQEEIARALKKAKPSYSSEQVVLARINQRLSALKADFRVTGYTSTDQPGTPQGFGQTQPADNSLGLAFNNSGEWWDVHLQGNVEGGERISNGSRFNANGAYGAVKFWNQWLSFGQVPQWWGPGYEGSLIRGDADAADDRFPDAAGRAGGAGNMVAALGRPVAVPDLRQPDESIYRCASCQNYRRSFHFLTFPVTGIRRVAHYAVGWGRATAIT